MRGSKFDLPKAIESKELAIEEAVWGDIHVSFESYNERLDTAPLMKGLPDDRCQCPHWGYVIKGTQRIKYKDREETVKQGEAYFTAPGHLVVLEAGTELVEFSPKDEFKKTMETVERNFAAMQK